MVEDFDPADETQEEAQIATVLANAYVANLNVKKDNGERRRAFAVFLYSALHGFPRDKRELESVAALVRFLEGGFVGPTEVD